MTRYAHRSGRKRHICLPLCWGSCTPALSRHKGMASSHLHAAWRSAGTHRSGTVPVLLLLWQNYAEGGDGVSSLRPYEQSGCRSESEQWQYSQPCDESQGKQRGSCGRTRRVACRHDLWGNIPRFRHLLCRGQAGHHLGQADRGHCENMEQYAISLVRLYAEGAEDK